MNAAPKAKRFLVAVCPKVKMITGQVSGGNFYQLKIEACDRTSAIAKARRHYAQNKEPGEFSPTFRAWETE